MKRPTTSFLIGFALLTAIIGLTATTKTVVAIPQASTQASSEYAGSDTCMICHADQSTHFQNTLMGKAFARPKTEKEKLGCEACHGPGKAHVDAGGGKNTIPVRFTKGSTTPVEERNATCLTCHIKGNQMFWTGSAHESRAMACVDCHQIHYGRVAERYMELA